MARALTILAEGQMPDMAKPLTGFGSVVMELALKHRGDLFRVVYALQIDHDIWVIHAFQKKSKSGVKTPKAEIDLIHERLTRLRLVRCHDCRCGLGEHVERAAHHTVMTAAISGRPARYLANRFTTLAADVNAFIA